MDRVEMTEGQVRRIKILSAILTKEKVIKRFYEKFPEYDYCFMDKRQAQKVINSFYTEVSDEDLLLPENKIYGEIKSNVETMNCEDLHKDIKVLLSIIQDLGYKVVSSVFGEQSVGDITMLMTDQEVIKMSKILKDRFRLLGEYDTDREVILWTLSFSSSDLEELTGILDKAIPKLLIDEFHTVDWGSK